MYRLKFTPPAETDLATLDKSIARLIYKRLRWLADNFEAISPIPLKGELKEFSKFRVGDYRALYTFDSSQKVVVIHFVRHRRDVYKEK